MYLNQNKKDEEKDLFASSNLEEIENAVENNQTTEFDEMGTPLNEI
jgi:hypothetical protein